jgi:TatD DNase family protein
MFVDSHCHLTFPGLPELIDEVRAAMAAARVDRALCICTTMEEFPSVHALALRHDNFWSTVGVHPDNEGVAEPSEADLVRLAGLPRVVAIGETGLDYYRLNGRSVDDMAWQRERFRTHIRAARRAGLPLVVHTRSASDDTVGILKEEGGERAGGVFHCFTETQAVARSALEMGFYVSFSGILTFKNASDLRAVAAMVPLDRCLIETDSPYLSPHPFRGKPNEPARAALTAATLASLRGLTEPELAGLTTANARALFALPPG